MDNAVVAFVLAAIAGLVLAAGAFWLATKSGLQPAQAALIETLKGNGDALEDKVKILETELAMQKDRRIRLERKVARLERVVIGLASQNNDLRQKLGMPSGHLDTAAEIDDEAEG
jgi:hypothetical protein